MSSPHLLAELLDNVTDHLHDTKDALRNCCLVSKSWIPRTRKHLFAEVRFEAMKDLESWKEIFPDPSTSPGHYTKSLLVHCLRTVDAADGEAGGWIRGFPRVEHFKLGCYDGLRFRTSLLSFRTFSPVLKSLHVEFVALPSLQVFDLILSFPLLKDLAVINSYEIPADYDDDGSGGPPPIIQHSNPIKFTGTLTLLMLAGMEPIARRLLPVPSGMHFRALSLMWVHAADISLTRGLVERCSHTLESLDITCDPNATSAAIDLSKATKLQEVILRPGSLSIQWITTAFQTTIPKHQGIQEISIHLHPQFSLIDADTIKESETYGEWMDLDRLLIQFWESRPNPPKVTFATGGEEQDVEHFAGCMLPELTRRGMISLGE